MVSADTAVVAGSDGFGEFGDSGDFVGSNGFD